MLDTNETLQMFCVEQYTIYKPIAYQGENGVLWISRLQ